ncbi:MAG: hypothetical protein LBN95_04650 [Prevotellaceae bacterium]|jgi:hypothetical protein|nr:hypothetical protein [Prevotellaceae bacterium]
MSTTFHFNSATEISPDFLTAILTIYKEKPVFITVEEEPFASLWQQEKVVRRAIQEKNDPDLLHNFDLVINELKPEISISDGYTIDKSYELGLNKLSELYGVDFRTL